MGVVRYVVLAAVVVGAAVAVVYALTGFESDPGKVQVFESAPAAPGTAGGERSVFGRALDAVQTTSGGGATAQAAPSQSAFSRAWHWVNMTMELFTMALFWLASRLGFLF